MHIRNLQKKLRCFKMNQSGSSFSSSLTVLCNILKFLLFFHQLLSRWKWRVFKIVWGCWSCNSLRSSFDQPSSDSQILILCQGCELSLVHEGDKLFSQEVLVPNKAHGSACPTFILVRDLGKSLVGLSHDFRMGNVKKSQPQTCCLFLCRV